MFPLCSTASTLLPFTNENLWRNMPSGIIKFNVFLSFVFSRFSFMRLCTNHKVLYCFPLFHALFIYFANVVFDFLTQQHEAADDIMQYLFFLLSIFSHLQFSKVTPCTIKKVFLFTKIFFLSFTWAGFSCVNKKSIRF